MGAEMKCPKCGHEWKSENQTAGGKARWSGTTKKQRKAAASAAAKARWAKTKRVASPANVKVSDAPDSAAPNRE
jgi:hypothetical protein